MIKIAQFEFGKDTTAGWVLIEWREGLSRDKTPIKVAKRTYHGRLDQVFKSMLEKASDDTDSIADLKSSWERVLLEIREISDLLEANTPEED